MPEHQCKNAINNRKGNMVPQEPTNLNTKRPEHSSAAEAQGNTLKLLYKDDRGP